MPFGISIGRLLYNFGQVVFDDHSQHHTLQCNQRKVMSNFGKTSKS